MRVVVQRVSRARVSVSGTVCGEVVSGEIVSGEIERGLLVLGSGPNVIRLCPPLVITRDQADFALDTLAECLKDLETN